MKRIAENTIESEVVRVIFTWSLLAVCLCSVLMYAYFVNKAVLQAVTVDRLMEQSNQITGRLGGLQTRYLSLANDVTLVKASLVGLAEIETERFISRKSIGKGLSLRDEI